MFNGEKLICNFTLFITILFEKLGENAPKAVFLTKSRFCWETTKLENVFKTIK